MWDRSCLKTHHARVFILLVLPYVMKCMPETHCPVEDLRKYWFHHLRLKKRDRSISFRKVVWLNASYHEPSSEDTVNISHGSYWYSLRLISARSMYNQCFTLLESIFVILKKGAIICDITRRSHHTSWCPGWFCVFIADDKISIADSIWTDPITR